MGNYIKKHKYILILIGLISLSTVLFFGIYFIKNLPLWYGTDIKPQGFFFFTEFKNLITNSLKDHTYPFYSWHMFLGNNFYASKGFYIMGDPFAYIGLLINTNFYTMEMILEIIKFYTAGLSMYYLLTQYHFKPTVRIIGSICFTFSGWAIFFSGQSSFLSFYCLMPLYFAGIEQYLQNKKCILYIGMCALLLFTNYYFFFTLSIFTVLYYIYRYYLLKDSFKGFWKDTFILIGYYLIGACITMILILPTLLYILGNDRVGVFKEGLFFKELQVYLSELISSLVPNYLYIYRDNVFETGEHYTREICMWAGSVTALLLPQMFACRDKKKKKGTVILYLIIVLICIFPILDSAVHGFSDPSFRWTCILTLFSITVAMSFLNDPENISFKVLKISVITIIAILAVSIPLACGITGDEISSHLKQICIFAIFALLFLFLYFILRSGSNRKLALVLVFTFAETTASGVYLYQEFLPKSESENYEVVHNVTHVLQDEPNQLNDYLNSIEEVNPTQYYRVYVPHDSLYWDYSHNMSVMYQLNGTMTYDSTYSPSLNKLKELEPEIKDFDSEWIFNIKNSTLLDFLNVKYAIVTKEEELPENGNWRLISDHYRSSLLIYRNDNYRELGTGYSKIKTYENYGSAHDLLDYIVCEQEDYEEISGLIGNDKAVLENISYYDNQLTGYAYSEDNSFMVITLPYDSGWKIKVNGQFVKTYDVNGGFIGIPIQAGDNSIEMYFTPTGFKEGAMLSCLGIVLFAAVIVIQHRKKKTDLKSNIIIH